MKYIGYNKANEMPMFHAAKNGLPLCGQEVYDTYEREGLPEKYFLCPACQRRKRSVDSLPHGEWTQHKLAAHNIRLCQEFKARQEEACQPQ